MKTEHIVIIVIIIIVIALIYRDTYKQTENLISNTTPGNTIIDPSRNIKLNIITNIKKYLTNYIENINNIQIYTTIFRDYNTIRTKILQFLNLCNDHYKLDMIVKYYNGRINYYNVYRNRRFLLPGIIKDFKNKINSNEKTKLEIKNKIKDIKTDIENLMSQFDSLNTEFNEEKNKIINDIYEITKPIDYNKTLFEKINRLVDNLLNVVRDYRFILDSFYTHMNKRYSDIMSLYTRPDDNKTFIPPPCTNNSTKTYEECYKQAEEGINVSLNNIKTYTINNETNKKVKYDITNFLYNKNGEFDSSNITRRIVDFNNTISSFIINNNLTVIKNLQNKSAIS